MSVQSTALAPARNRTFLRRAGAPAKLAIASIAVAAAIVLVVVAVAMSRGSAAPLAASGGGGHPAPMTSSFDRALEAGSAAVVGTALGTSAAIGPSIVIIESPVTGRSVRVPADTSPVEGTIESLGTTTATSTILVTNAAGGSQRLPLP